MKKGQRYIRGKGTPEQRFWAHVDKTPSCWLWTGTLRNGYGRFNAGDDTYVSAHRWLFERERMVVPEGFDLDHLCHNLDNDCGGGDPCRHRRCVRPDHLEIVTRQTNSFRGRSFILARATQTHCINGHPYDEENTYIRTDGRTRDCRACGRLRWPARSLRRQERKREPRNAE